MEELLTYAQRRGLTQHTRVVTALQNEQAAERARVQADSAMLSVEVEELLEILNA